MRHRHLAISASGLQLLHRPLVSGRYNCNANKCTTKAKNSHHCKPKNGFYGPCVSSHSVLACLPPSDWSLPWLSYQYVVRKVGLDMPITISARVKPTNMDMTPVALACQRTSDSNEQEPINSGCWSSNWLFHAWSDKIWSQKSFCYLKRPVDMLRIISVWVVSLTTFQFLIILFSPMVGFLDFDYRLVYLFIRLYAFFIIKILKATKILSLNP
jgi:hypothetical protein